MIPLPRDGTCRMRGSPATGEGDAMDQPTGIGRLSEISTAWTVLRQLHAGTGAEADEALQLLAHRYRGAVYRYLRHALGDADTAEDLTQEFFLDLLRGRFRHAD